VKRPGFRDCPVYWATASADRRALVGYNQWVSTLRLRDVSPATNPRQEAFDLRSTKAHPVGWSERDRERLQWDRWSKSSLNESRHSSSWA
jgi:hypothetical protein